MYERVVTSMDVRRYCTMTAQEIIRRTDPENEMIKQCFAPQRRDTMEFDGVNYGGQCTFQILLRQAQDGSLLSVSIGRTCTFSLLLLTMTVPRCPSYM